jgi:tetratricopeptide (TPR) repeat protein
MERRSAATFTAMALGICLTGLAHRATALAGPLADDTAEASARRAPYHPESVRRAVKFWEGRVARTPGRFLEFRELAGAYLARLRETGDVEDAVRAERAARRSLELQARGNLAALTRLARSLIAQHRFPEALEAANRAAAIDPAALLLVADIELELGHDEPARSAFAKASVDPEHLNAIILRARFAQADGDFDRAVNLLREATRQSDELSDLPAETAAWFHVMVGHTLIDRGRLDEGTVACRKALSIFPRDYRAMTGLAEASAYRGEWEDAIAWASRAIEACPQNPEALRLLHEAYSAVGDRDQAEGKYRRFKELAHSFPRIYDRHWAMFCADNGRDLDEAYSLAKKDLQLRQDPGAYETLAWVAFRKGFRPEAETAINTAMGLKLSTASTFLHAATIARSGGDLRGAESHLARAKELNPYLVKMTGAARPSASTD